ncbi:MAG: site-specific integrase [Hyphomicrobiales bacterium]|nr:site-specific integrase [Hyphomicrobiales bacterium]
MKGRLARGEPIDRIPQEIDVTFEQFAWNWFDEYVVPNNKRSEQWTKRRLLRSALIPFFGRIVIVQITARHIEQYKASALKAGRSNKTINNHLTVLRKCLYTAYEWLSLPGTPPKITRLKCPPTTADYLSPDECSLLLSSARGTTYEMILTALRTGMRQGELKGLQWPSIDWQNRSIAVQHSRCDFSGELTSPKNNRIRHIPMDTDVYEMLWRRKQCTGYVFLNERERPFDEQALRRRLARVRHRAGLRKIGWHTLRHTFASHLAMRGVPMTAIQTLLGHSSITTTMRYAHLAPSALRAAIDMLNPKVAIGADFGQPAVNGFRTERGIIIRDQPTEN